MLGRRSALDVRSRAALARILADPTFELVPLRNAAEQAAFLPPGAIVSVTASPAKGIEATVELGERLQGLGFRAVPHLAARMVRDRAHLRELLGRLEAAGIERTFVVGGDAEEPGPFPDALSLLREMADLGHRLTEIGIACYPEGHAFIPENRLQEALVAKAPFAAYMTTQLCFDPAAIGRWLSARRAQGISLPVHVGAPGIVELPKLVAISARIGVTDSRRYLAKNTGLVGRLLRPGGFRPERLLEGLAPLAADPSAGLARVHLFTFNQVQPTETWRRRYRSSLALAEPA